MIRYDLKPAYKEVKSKSCIADCISQNLITMQGNIIIANYSVFYHSGYSFRVIGGKLYYSTYYLSKPFTKKVTLYLN